MSRPLAVVTGAARGIGSAVATTLAGQGFDLLLLDICADDVTGLTYPLATPDELAATLERCTGLGAAVTAEACDVRAADRLTELTAGLPVVAAVAVAGIIGADGLAWELTPDDVARDLSVNLHGVVNLARATVPGMIARGTGRFVCVVSSAGERGLPRLASYVASKHAALGYLRSLAADLGPSGVTANAVLPGSTRTALLERSAAAYDLSSISVFETSQRINRLIEPAEIASVVGWLCSPGASAITGAAVSVDGGFIG